VPFKIIENWFFDTIMYEYRNGKIQEKIPESDPWLSYVRGHTCKEVATK